MLLEDKVAVVYGAGGAVGGAVARAFAREGAEVFLAGRRPSSVDAVAAQIHAAGGRAHPAELDAIDESAVNRHAAEVVALASRIDVSFNLVSHDHVQGVPLVDLAARDFAPPIAERLTSQLLTAQAAARQMAGQRSGVLLFLTAQVARVAWPLVGGFGVACAAVEGLGRSLAAELGPHGVRVVCLRSSGSPGANGVEDVWQRHANQAETGAGEWRTHLTERTLLRRLPTLDEVADVAVLMASDRAAVVTGAVTNVSCGEVVD